MDQDWLTIKQAAEKVERDRGTIYKWKRQGKLVTRKMGKEFFVEPASLYRAARMPYMEELEKLRQEINAKINPLVKEVADLKNENHQLRHDLDLVRQKIGNGLLEEEPEMVPAAPPPSDDLTTKPGVRKYLARHNMNPNTLKKKSYKDPTFPVGKDEDGVLDWSQEQAEESEGVRKIDPPEQCNPRIWPNCRCHTHQPPLLPYRPKQGNENVSHPPDA